MPTLQNRCLLLDAGANVDCSAENLKQFAVLGAVYAERVWGVSSPRVGLLNIGGEAGKGNELTKDAHALLRDGVPEQIAMLLCVVYSSLRVLLSSSSSYGYLRLI